MRGSNPHTAASLQGITSTMSGSWLALPLCIAGCLSTTASIAGSAPTQTRLLVGNGVPSLQFGQKVDLDGDVAVIASTTATPIVPVRVFERSAGAWLETATLTPGDGAVGAVFGYDVAVSGQTIVVSAPERAGEGPRRSGVYVYELVNGVWAQTAKLTVIDPQTTDQFGVSVDISGDSIVIGADGADRVGFTALQGVAYVFVRTGQTWQLQQKIFANDGNTFDNFGGSVAIEGDRMLAGSIGSDNGNANPHFNVGAAYVFERVGVQWTQRAKLIANDGMQMDFLGGNVALSGNVVVAGAARARIGNVANQGAAYVFESNGNNVWTQVSKLTAADGVTNEYFSAAGVSISGSAIWIGLPGHLVNGQQIGAAYSFRRGADNLWTQRARIEPFDNVPGQFFGTSIATDRDTTMVGATAHNGSRGAVYVLFSAQIFRDGYEGPQ